jgi:hypothetical protein
MGGKFMEKLHNVLEDVWEALCVLSDAQEHELSPPAGRLVNHSKRHLTRALERAGDQEVVETIRAKPLACDLLEEEEG